MKSRTWQQTLVGSTGLTLAACWFTAGRLGAEERVFDNNFAEVAATTFFQRHDRWPTSIVEMASLAIEGPVALRRPALFKPEDYRSMGFEVLPDGSLRLTLTAPSGRSETHICEKPPTDADRVIGEQGYLIIHDGSSFYYLARDGTFISGPLNSWCGRVIEGTYQSTSPMSFEAFGTMIYLNRPSRRIWYDMGFEINSVRRDGEPFDANNFAPLRRREDGAERVFPANPVCHRAYFVFNRLIPVAESTNAVAAVVEGMRGISMQQPAMAQNQSTPQSRQRDRVYAMLMAFGTNAVPAVAAALTDPDVGMRRNAALVLIDLNAPWSRKARVDTTAALPALIRAMDDPDAHVRAWAAHAIEPMGPAGAPAVPALIRLLSDPDEGPRNDSAIALRAIGAAAKSALPALRRNLEDPMKDPRNFARRAIEAIEADIVREEAPGGNPSRGKDRNKPEGP